MTRRTKGRAMPCTRRAVLRSATAAAVTLAVPRRPRAQNPVRIGSAVLGAYTLSASVLVALEKGFFREQGVAAEFVPFRGGLGLVTARAQGWEPVRDGKIVGLGGRDAQDAALARKEIAAFVWGDYGAVTGAQGRTQVVLRMDSLTPRWIASIQYSSEEHIRKSAEAIRGSTRALFQALRFMKGNPEETARIIGPRLGWAPAVVQAVYTACAPVFSADGRIEPPSLRAMQDALLEAGSIQKRLPPEEHYTTDFTPVRL